MPAPVEFPEWATGGGAAIDEPLTAEKELGWVNAMKPPAGWLNWWMNLVYQWIVWFDDNDPTENINNVKHPPSVALTFASNRRLSTATWGDRKMTVNWSSAGRISTIVLEEPLGSTQATYTPTYTGRRITAWTKS